MLINVEGWPALLPRAKGSHSSGAPPGLCILGTCWWASARLPSAWGTQAGGQQCCRKGLMPGKKPKGTAPKPLGQQGAPLQPAVPRGKRPLGLSVPRLRGRADEEEAAVAEGGAGSQCRGRPVGASLRETGTSPAQPGRTAGLLPSLFQFLPSPRALPRPESRRAFRSQRGWECRGGRVPPWLVSDAGRAGEGLNFATELCCAKKSWYGAEEEPGLSDRGSLVGCRASACAAGEPSSSLLPGTNSWLLTVGAPLGSPGALSFSEKPLSPISADAGWAATLPFTVVHLQEVNPPHSRDASGVSPCFLGGRGWDGIRADLATASKRNRGEKKKKKKETEPKPPRRCNYRG